MKRGWMTAAAAMVISGILTTAAATAQEQQAEPALPSTVTQAALFKNGLGFFTAQTVLPEDTTAFTITPMAAAAHGTFWVSYPQAAGTVRLVAGEEDATEEIPAISVEELLRANVGEMLHVTMGDKTVSGKLTYFAENRPGQTPEPYPFGGQPARQEERARMVLIETEDQGVLAVDPSRITSVRFNGNAKTTFSVMRKAVTLHVQMEYPAAGETLTTSYLAKGMTWAPSYLVDITDAAMATLTAKAEIINEAGDLQDTMVQLVTGFPHWQFADIVSPLAMKTNLAEFLKALQEGSDRQDRERRHGVLSNVMTQTVSLPGMAGETPMPAYGTAQQGQTTEDLFFYPLHGVNLRKGQTGYYGLFTEKVPYQHVYRWEIPDYVGENDVYSYSYNSEPKPQPQEEVWHCLRLTNDTKAPWTTAPAQTMKDGFILGQDTLNYTPASAKALLKITRAVNVKAEQNELEINRKREALKHYEQYYDLITLEGKLQVMNMQDKAITLEITKTLSGEVIQMNPEAAMEKPAKGLRRMNSMTKLTWSIDLAAGEQKEISYQYKVYVRR